MEFGVLDKDHGVAYGTYEDAINTTGYDYLFITVIYDPSYCIC